MKPVRYKLLHKSNYCKTHICHLEREDWLMKYPSINQVQEVEIKKYISHILLYV